MQPPTRVWYRSQLSGTSRVAFWRQVAQAHSGSESINVMEIEKDDANKTESWRICPRMFISISSMELPVYFKCKDKKERSTRYVFLGCI